MQAAKIVDRSAGVEGIDVCRLDAAPGATFDLCAADGHIVSVLAGSVALESAELPQPLTLRAGVHAYIPPGINAKLRCLDATTAIAASADDAFARGDKLLLHDEAFLRASRFILTPQYLSRRAFLNRDKTLMSKSGDPVAWFHTTMFDTHDLPRNYEGIGVFKMSYDHQSEINVIYEVSGSAKVRFACHPYASADEQRWSNWADLDGQTTYHLNESSSGDEVENHVDPDSGQTRSLRNKHEIYIEPKGYVSLCCLFDPGPTGIEMHYPGEYSAYAPAREVVDTLEYKRYLRDIKPLDEMLRSLSMAVAIDPNVSIQKLDHWSMYQTALKNAKMREDEMIKSAAAGRRSILEPWRIRSLERDN